jgi:hypothetical protein
MTHKSLCFAESAPEMGHLLTFDAKYLADELTAELH